MIGRAKMAGAGAARIEIGGLTLARNDGTKPPDAATMMGAFAGHMAQAVPGWATSGPIKSCLALATPGYSDDNGLDYLPLEGHKPLRQHFYHATGEKERNNMQKQRLLSATRG